MAAIIARIYLALVGATYLGLGIWCAVAPERTSATVGFALQSGQGQSEFLTVYGGLEVALGILFLWPIFRKEQVGSALLACLIVHGCLVLFRTVGFLIYTDFVTTTYTLAISEWALFLAAASLFYIHRRVEASRAETLRGRSEPG